MSPSAKRSEFQKRDLCPFFDFIRIVFWNIFYYNINVSGNVYHLTNLKDDCLIVLEKFYSEKIAKPQIF